MYLSEEEKSYFLKASNNENEQIYENTYGFPDGPVSPAPLEIPLDTGTRGLGCGSWPAGGPTGGTPGGPA